MHNKLLHSLKVFKSEKSTTKVMNSRDQRGGMYMNYAKF